MIGFLRGTLLEKHAPNLLIDVGGIGYEVQAPMTTFYQLPDVGNDIALHTHFVVREDAQLLYGFSDRQTREIFRELIRVNGLGPKMALAILSAMDGEALIRCIENNQLNTLVRVPGIGRKTAERLLVELRDRVQQWSGKLAQPLSTTGKIPTITDAQAIQADAESALQALGYKPLEAEKAIAAILRDHTIKDTEDLIRLALRNMVTR